MKRRTGTGAASSRPARPRARRRARARGLVWLCETLFDEGMICGGSVAGRGSVRLSALASRDSVRNDDMRHTLRVLFLHDDYLF